MSDTTLAPSTVLRAIFLSVKRQSFSRKQTLGQKIILLVSTLSVFILSMVIFDTDIAICMTLGIFIVIRWQHLGVMDIEGGIFFVWTILYTLLLFFLSEGYAVLYKGLLIKVKKVRFFPEFPYNDQTFTKSLTRNEIHSRDTFWGPKMPRSFPSPNTLTMVRAIGAVGLGCFHDVSAIVFFPAAVFLALTDLFDGVIARTQGRETIFGKWADPIADRMLLLSVAVFLYHRNPDFWNSVGIKILVPEGVFILIGIMMLTTKRKIVPRAVFWGRVRFVLYLLSASAILFGAPAFAGIFLNMGCLFAWVANASYLTRFYQESHGKSVYNGALEWLAGRSDRIQKELSPRQS